MRIIVNLLMGLMLFATAGLVFYVQQDADLETSKVDQLKNAVVMLRTQSMLQPASEKVDALPNGHAKSIEQAWFEPVPTNPFAPKHTPWLEVSNNIKLKHPEYITFGDKRSAFWYNPHLGIVRARVSQQISQVATYELYNQVNRTHLSERAHTSQIVDKVADAAK